MLRDAPYQWTSASGRRRGQREASRESLSLVDGPHHSLLITRRDPVGFTKNASPEKKERGRLIEINNGRLAMLGLFGFLAESKLPGSVPALGGIALPYDGDYMAPFAADFHIF